AKADPTSQTRTSLFPYAYHALVTWNVLTTYWVANTAFLAGIFAIWVNPLLIYLPFLAFHLTKKALPKIAYAALIVYWIAFEKLHLTWELSWSWLTLGNAFARFPSWVQWYEYTGVFGGTLWILGLNVLVFSILKKAGFQFSWAKIWGEQKIRVLGTVALILLPILISLAIYSKQQDKGREVEVVVVQPNFEPHYQKFELPIRQQIEQYLTLSAAAITDKTEYLLWSETSFSAGRINELKEHSIIRELQSFLTKYPKVKLVTGVAAYKIFEPGEPHTGHTRTEIEGNDTIYWEAYNASLQVEAGVDSIPFYIKSKLVPGAEILPYHKYLFFLKPIVDQLEGSVEGHGSQPYREAFPSGSGKVAPVVCYESVFGEYHTGYVKAGAQATFIMTNDGWWDNTAGHKQHLQFATLRAIETRRSIARSANTGISCFINQRGDILQPTKYGVPAAIRGTIKFNDELTFYVRWGDLIARVAVFAAVIFLLNTLVKSILQKNKQVQA
ncbi:MAG: apolipoprotein N-acyltransferase, partial [Bacteroidota bacterium]